MVHGAATMQEEGQLKGPGPEGGGGMEESKDAGVNLEAGRTGLAGDLDEGWEREIELKSKCPN